MIAHLLDKYHQLFDNLAEKWRHTTGGDLLLVSLQGEVLRTGNNRHLNESVLDVRISQDGALTLAPSLNGSAVSTRLHVQGETAGFLLSLNTSRRHQPLLDWAAETLSLHATNQHALQGMTDELIEAWDQLELIYRVIKTLGAQANLTEVLRSIIGEIRKVINTEDGFVLLEYEGALEIVTCDTSHRADSFNRELLTRLLTADHLVLCNEAKSCRQFWPNAPASLHNFIGTGIPTAGFASAAMGLVNNNARSFNAGDVKLLTVMSDHLGAIIDNFLMHKQLIIQERVQRELEIAAEIQTSLHPHRLPNMEGITISVASLPANEIGGDFYDFVRCGDGCLTVIIGDVAGKGIPAAMLTSMTRIMLRVESSNRQPPSRIIERANEILQQDLSQADSFVTAFVATIDTRENRLSFANAGHTPALLWHAQTRSSQFLRATSLPVGIANHHSKPAPGVSLLPGDLLILYTDGITEASNPAGQLFGLDRLQQLVDRHAAESPEILQTIVLYEVERFRHSAARTDDATILVIKLWPQAIANVPVGDEAVLQTFSFKYRATIECLPEILEQVTQACHALDNLPPEPAGADFVYLVELAVSEICTNIIRHAYPKKPGRINGIITLFPIGIQIDLFDNGESFDPASVPPYLSNPMDLVEGGYGLYIVRQVMDLVQYEPETPRGNHWKLIKYLPA